MIHKTPAYRLIVLVSLVVQAAVLASTPSNARPFGRKEAIVTEVVEDDKRDPLIALPSEIQHSNADQAVPNPEEPSPHYSVQSQNPMQYVQYQPVEYELAGRTLETDPNTMQQPSAHQHNIYCDHRVGHSPTVSEQEAPSGTRAREDDQTSGILYIRESGVAGSSNDQLKHYGSGLSSVANMISESSGMPATILTEVPAKDMPQEVLDKLRRDYGVKIVATRERPGASLVINCEEHSGLESSICAKSPELTSTGVNPLLLATPETHDSSLGQAHGPPNVPRVGSSGQSTYGTENSGGRIVEYVQDEREVNHFENDSAPESNRYYAPRGERGDEHAGTGATGEGQNAEEETIQQGEHGQSQTLGDSNEQSHSTARSSGDRKFSNEQYNEQ